jgi:hypothetical protein
VSDGEQHHLFLLLSEVLTGFNQFDLLATGMAPGYFDRARSGIGTATFAALLSVAADLSGCEPSARQQMIGSRIFGNAPLRLAAQRIVMLWYTGSWYDTNPYGGDPISAAAYVEGLVWKAIRSHPMAAKPQGFGAWSLPPPVRCEE